MSELYQEILVKRNTPTGDKVKKYALIVATAVCVAAGIVINPVILLAAIVLGVVCYIFIPSFDLEYEYLYVNGELDIDKIMSKQKRKKCATYNIENLELMAPSNSRELDRFRNKSDVKQKDYTSLDPNVSSYTLVFNQDKGQEMVKVELNEIVVNDIRRLAPRKFSQY